MKTKTFTWDISQTLGSLNDFIHNLEELGYYTQSITEIETKVKVLHYPNGNGSRTKSLTKALIITVFIKPFHKLKAQPPQKPRTIYDEENE